MTRSSKNPEVAWDFVNFMLRPENQQQLLEMTGWMPARQDVEYKEQIRKAPQFKAFFDAPDGYDFYWYTPLGPFDEILTKLAARLERAYADKSLVDNPAGIAKVIEDMAKETNDILRREGHVRRIAAPATLRRMTGSPGADRDGGNRPAGRQPAHARHLRLLLSGLAPRWLRSLCICASSPSSTTLAAGLYNWDMIRPIRVFVGLGNYIELLRDPNFQVALFNTRDPSGRQRGAGDGHRPGPGDHGQRQRITGAPIYQLIYFLPVVTPWVPITVVWKWIYDARFGPLNQALAAIGLPGQAWLVDDRLALVSILIVMVWKTLGYNLIMFLVGLNNIPQEYYEAAVVDGAVSAKIFRYITLPLLKPMLLFVVVISTINAFNVFTPVFMMTSDIQGAAAKLVRTLVYDMWENGFRYFRVGYASAEAALLLTIVLILTLMNMRLFREDR